MSDKKNGERLLSAETLNRLKYEVADELGLRSRIDSAGWSDMTSRECGSVGGPIGGSMVKLMIRYAQQQMVDGQPPE
jgi:hypothetical protein